MNKTDLPVVTCPHEHPHHHLNHATMRKMTPARAMPAPYGYIAVWYVHFLRSDRYQCNHTEMRMIKDA